MNMENLERDHVIKQVKSIIKENYEFMAYLEFALTLDEKRVK